MQNKEKTKENPPKKQTPLYKPFRDYGDDLESIERKDREKWKDWHKGAIGMLYYG